MIKIHYNPKSSEVVFAYDSEIQDIPEPNILITDDEWNNFNKKQCLVIDGKLVINEKVEHQKALKKEEWELLKYLSDTDWYVNRQTEKGTPIPDDVSIKRNDARERISAIREVITIDNKKVINADTRDTII